MAYDEFWLIRWVIPLLFSCLLFYLLFYRRTLNTLVSNIKNEKLRAFFFFVLDGLKLQLGDWRITILLSVIGVIILEFFLAFIFNASLGGYRETWWFALITSCFLNPIYEEFVMRGLLLSAFVYAGLKRPNYKYALYGIGLVITNIFFVLSHTNSSLYEFTARFMLSSFFGIFYLFTNRNLLPSILSHSANNFFLFILDVSNGFGL